MGPEVERAARSDVAFTTLTFHFSGYLMDGRRRTTLSPISSLSRISSISRPPWRLLRLAFPSPPLFAGTLFGSGSEFCPPASRLPETGEKLLGVLLRLLTLLQVNALRSLRDCDVIMRWTRKARRQILKALKSPPKSKVERMHTGDLRVVFACDTSRPSHG